MSLAQRSSMRKALPATMFGDTEQARIATLRNWVLDHDVTETEMSERQFWNFALLATDRREALGHFHGRQMRGP